MPRMAFIRDDLAVNVVAAGHLQHSFHPDLAALFEPVPSVVEVGWRRDGEGHWHAPVTPSDSDDPASPPPP